MSVYAPRVPMPMALLACGCASGLSRPVSSIDAVTDCNGVQRVDHDLHSFYFTPKVPGEYRFYCDEHGHAAKGMTGTLVVVR